MGRHFIEVCVCGNTLSQCRCPDPGKLKIRRSPCRCEEPGPGHTTAPGPWLPQALTEQHVSERRKLGLPMLTDIEKHAFKKTRA